MRLYSNLTDGAITRESYERVHVSSAIPLKYKTETPIEVQFHRDGTPELLPASSAITLGLKVTGEYDAGDFLASVTDWTAPGDASGFYEAILNTDTSGLDGLLEDDGNVANDVALEDVMAEVSYLTPTATLPDRSQTFTIRVHNAVNRGVEGEPAESGNPTYYNAVESDARYVPQAPLTALTGGAATALDAIVTVGQSDLLRWVNDATEGFGLWQLIAGTTAESAAGGIVRPDDYAASSNEKIWIRRL